MQDSGLQRSTGYGKGLGVAQGSAVGMQWAFHRVHSLEGQARLGNVGNRKHAQGLMIISHTAVKESGQVKALA